MTLLDYLRIQIYLTIHCILILVFTKHFLDKYDALLVFYL